MFRYKFLSMVILAGMLISQAVPQAMAATICDSAQFVSDLTIPDGSSFAPGTTFTKTWRLLNNGTCTWTTSYKLVWVGGDQMKAPLTLNLPVNVLPGRMLDLSVRLTAPTTLGHYKALFKITNSKGIQFGIGSSSNDAFWADINVVDVSAVIYDFVANAPYAQWKSGAGNLPFPGASGDFRGYSSQVTSPHLEDDSYDTAPGLLTVPQNKLYGYIQATYPEIQIQSGDQLQTLVNCEFGATGCRATFRIDYLLPNNTQKTLWTWTEAYDRRFYRANLNLSSLAGQKVRFIFMLLSGGSASGDRAIWGSPRILRTGTYQPPAPPSTLTPLPPLPATPTPLDQPPPTIVPAGCDKATFVTDVTVPDGTIFAPGATFTKTWRLKNTGACIWTPSYKLVYYSGEQMSAPTTVNLPWGAAPNQTVDISVNMVAPLMPAEYRGYWILQNVNGQFFGIGTDASKPIWVDINVSGESTNEGGYDFALNTCAAQWRSGSGPLLCPGTEGDSKGFVIPQQSTQLEDGTTGPAPSILIFPENKYNGYIQGIFPAFTVQPRDHFVTGTGCEYNYGCYVTFRLDYITATGSVYNFWSWREQNDKKNNRADIDLSPLAGRSVRFILTILATGTASGDRARWIGPYIVRVESGTPPTITPNPSTWPLYTNTQYGFQFKYPPQSQIVNQSDNSIKLNLPFTPGTNLAEKYLQMSVNENVSPCQSPLSATSRPGSPTETVVINGISFFKQIGGDAGMSQLYEWVAYSTLRGNACISMDFMLHSIATGAYSTPPPVFDKVAESTVFTQIMSMFTWIPATATPTPAPVSGTIVPLPQINKLYMNDAYHGWAIGRNYVLKTSDGGATWYNVTAPGVTRVISAFFTNANKGWVMATVLDSTEHTVLFRTTTGGSTWITYNVPFNDGYIQFLDDSNGFVLAGQGIGMQKQPVSLYQTSNGGATWTLKFAHDPNLPDNGLPVSGHKNGMTFRNTTRGWIGGDVPVSGSVYIFRTDNGGVTWAQQPMAIPTGYENANVGTTAPIFFGSSYAILPVWMGSAVGQRDLFLYVTYDGGTTWSRSSSFASHSYNADFVTIRDGFSWDPNGFLRVTHNSGASWTQITPNVNFGDGVSNLDFVSTTTGWILDADDNFNTALYRTTNGGSTWIALFSNIPAGPLPDLTITGFNMGLQNATCLTAGDVMGIQVGIKNNGQGAAGSFVVRVNNIDQTVNGLGVGETTTLFFPTSINPVSAVVDATSTVQESDENNNTRSEMVPVPTSPLPCVTTPAEFEQTIVNTLNAKNFDAAKNMMGQSFGMAFWQSQGNSYTPDLAIQQLQTNYIAASTVLVSDPSRDLNALLGGLNPYSIMNLDPSNSQAMFVSGWGLDGKSEAILYVTRLPDGSLYWNSVLIAVGGFAPPAPAPLIGPYAVVRVAPNDVLSIRSAAGASQPVIGSFAANATNVMRTGSTVNADSATWVEIQNPSGGTGWVNASYLTEYVTHDAFCADTRIPILIEQLKGSMDQSNSDMFARLIGPKHGASINFWNDVPSVNYTSVTAQSIFTDATVYNWGTGPSGGPTGTSGTFAQIIEPDMVSVFNSGYQLGCDNPSYAESVSVNPWPYTNIHYYSILQPPTQGTVFDWKVWLVGFEYVDGVPYLYGAVHYIWEP